MKKIQAFGADRGYTLIELIIVIAITATLSTLVTVSFQRLRIDQRQTNAVNDLISKLREVQNAILSGKLVNGLVPKDYDLVFRITTPTLYAIDSITLTSPGPPPITATTALETISLPPDIVFGGMQVNNVTRTDVRTRINSPFGRISSLKISAGSCGFGGAGPTCTNENATIQIDLLNQVTNRTRSVIIDGISGRIYSQ